jgi:biotin synthase
MSTRFEEILEKSQSSAIDRDEALFLFKETEDEAKSDELFRAARGVRETVKGNVFEWSAGIARVLRCNLQPLCRYCPYWREKGQTPLTIEEILRGVAYIKQHGIKKFHLSGGTTLGSDGRDILSIVQAIRKAGFDDLAIEVNCGAALSLETLKELKTLGVYRVSSVFETVNPAVFKAMKPGDDLEAKKQFALRIGEAGLKLGTGVMAGLSPMETRYQDYVNFMFHVKSYEHLEYVYVTKFSQFKGILMQGHPPCSAREAARVIAVMRLVLREVNIGSAAGWSSDDYPTPFMAGCGNRAGGIHVNRTTHYKDDLPPGEYSYQDNMEFHNTMEATRARYAELRVSIVP